MIPDDRALLDRVRRLHSTLSHRAVLLGHVQSDVDVFAEGLRDLGHELADLGELCLARVAELDRYPVDHDKNQSSRINALSGMLTELTLERCSGTSDGGQ